MAEPIDYEITFTDSPAADEVALLFQGLRSHSGAIFGPTWSKSIAFYLRDVKGTIVGGVYGNYGCFNWLYVDTLWVSDEARGHGNGSRLLQAIENEAIKNGCTSVYLDTFSFQAPEFYKKLGYTIFGELDNFPDGYSRIFLRKELSK